MSKVSRQRMREAAQRRAKRKSRWIPRVAIIFLLTAAVSCCWAYLARKHAGAVVASEQAAFKMPSSYAELCAVSTNDLAKCDIALMNLLCAEGLRGAEDLNIPDCLATLDRIAASVKFNIQRAHYKYTDHPEEFHNSEGYFDMMMLATVVQQDYNIHYDPAHIELPGADNEPDSSFYADARDVFIHGLTRPNGMGTCSSMPVFYVAIGRRLGYPLKLVRAKGHLFARWDEGDRSFNIECTSVGFVSHTDEEYRTWPATFTPEEEKSESYLKSLTPVQELAVFLSTRGFCLRASGNLGYSLGAMEQAFYKEPESVGNQKLFARAEYEAYKAGVLPKRAEIQYELRTLDIPGGPMYGRFVQEKAALQAMNLAEANVVDIETGLMVLKAEVASSQKKH